MSIASAVPVKAVCAFRIALAEALLTTISPSGFWKNRILSPDFKPSSPDTILLLFVLKSNIIIGLVMSYGETGSSTSIRYDRFGKTGKKENY